jgi:hypothetical protein
MKKILKEFSFIVIIIVIFIFVWIVYSTIPTKVRNNIHDADELGGSIPFDRKERYAAFERIWDGDCSFAKLLSKCDDEYYNTDIADQILEMLTQYMRLHPQEFVLEGDFEFFDD